MAQNELNFPSRSRTQALGKLYKKITNEDMPAGANTTTEALQKVYEALTEDTKHHTNVTKIIDDLATNWSGGGGGGSSDFSTATVTVVGSEVGHISSDFYTVPAIVEGEGAVPVTVFAMDEPHNFTATLYKGMATFGVPENVIVSGDATYDEANAVVHIFGDCSIKGYLFN